jgi:hypothetical protein
MQVNPCVPEEAARFLREASNVKLLETATM